MPSNGRWDLIRLLEVKHTVLQNFSFILQPFVLEYHMVYRLYGHYGLPIVFNRCRQDRMFPWPVIIVVTFGLKFRFTSSLLSTAGKKFFSNRSLPCFLPLTLPNSLSCLSGYPFLQRFLVSCSMLRSGFELPPSQIASEIMMDRSLYPIRRLQRAVDIRLNVAPLLQPQAKSYSTHLDVEVTVTSLVSDLTAGNHARYSRLCLVFSFRLRVTTLVSILPQFPSKCDVCFPITLNFLSNPPPLA